MFVVDEDVLYVGTAFPRGHATVEKRFEDDVLGTCYRVWLDHHGEVLATAGELEPWAAGADAVADEVEQDAAEAADD